MHAGKIAAQIAARIAAQIAARIAAKAQHGHSSASRTFASRSYDLFLKEWREKGHVQENYNAITGSGDDVSSSDRFYHWGALLGYIQYLEQDRTTP